MNKKIVIIIVLVVLIIIIGVISYFLLKKPQATPQATPQTTPAQCRSGTTTFTGGQEASIQANVDSNYNFDSNSTLGISIKENIERFFFPERFALTTTGDNRIIVNKNDLVNNKWYYTGLLDTTKQVSTITQSINGGASCVPFPNTVYREAPASISSFSLVSEMNWYPYGSTANFVKSNIGVSSLDTAINYANNNGFTAFSFNENSTSTDPNDINSKILFFREDNINQSTFFTNGAAVSGFRVYAIGFSKLRTMTCPSGQIRDTGGVCRLNACPIDQTRDSNGVCRWNACPSNSTLNNISGECPCNSDYRKAPGKTGRNDLCYPICQQTDPLKIGIDVADMDINGNCVCRQGYIKANNGQCYKPCISPSQRMNDNGSCSCAPGYMNLNLGIDLNCQPNNCPSNSTLIPGGWNNTGICQCNLGFQKAPGRTGDRDPCFQSCPLNYDMQSDGSCKLRILECPPGTTYSYNPNTGGKCITETNDGGLRTQLEIEQMLGGITG